MNIRLTTLAAMISLLVPISVKAQQKPAIKLDDPGDFEVRRPEGFDDQEWRVLHSIETLSTERLVQLLLVYERLNNAGMLDVLVRSILKRDPKNKEAQRVRDGGQAEETVRPAGYLEELSRKVMAGERVADPDSVPVLAMSLILEGRAPEAVTLLEKLRANHFKGASYPYLDDLA